ncbi:aquaporin Z [Acinetobacter baumannii]|uniref:aquaporin Z n=6 Tax=Gammaproteobacteria TaxID=1236 RepID=UPI0022EAF680|nr:aquaporin Z [Acinetobacter baumannii]MDA3434404.1 aquaporin Z [Acinetobacter baumannii]
MNKYFAEFLGTFWLVFGGCGSAVLAAAFPELGIGFAGVALAFGLTVLTGAYALGHISGGHFNPAVSVGLWVGGRFDVKDLIPYIVAQVVGATAAAFVLYIIAQGQAGFSGVGGFATNGFGDLSPNKFGDLSPNKFGLGSAFIIEVVLTAFFLIIILGATDRRAPAGFAPIAIGLGLTLIHLISIPVTNTSVNPARSTGVAFFAETAALSQLWLFWVAPILGAVIGAIIYKVVAGDKD